MRPIRCRIRVYLQDGNMCRALLISCRIQHEHTRLHAQGRLDSLLQKSAIGFKLSRIDLQLRQLYDPHALSAGAHS